MATDEREVEAVARALTEPGAWEIMSDIGRGLYLDDARAAIRALDRHRASVGPSDDVWCRQSYEWAVKRYLDAQAARHDGEGKP